MGKLVRGYLMIRAVAAMRRCCLPLVLGTSALAWGVAAPSGALAQCAPDPTLANGATTCTGTDANGIRVTTHGTMLTVSSGAAVSNTGAPAIVVEVPNTQSTISERINVSGQVTGGAQSGITLLTGPVATYNGSTVRLALTVAAGAAFLERPRFSSDQAPAIISVS